MAFPTESALAGLVAAACLTWLRARLRRGEHGAPALTEPARWRLADVVALLVVIGLALLARLVGLASRPVDNDEPVALFVASLGDWAAGADARLHPPLPALMFGLARAGRIDLDAARSVSALFGVATVALVFAIGRRHGGRGAAVLAAGLCALAPAAIHTSQLARGYALLTFFVLLAHSCASRALASGRQLWWSAYSLAVAAAVASEYLAIFPLVADALVALLLHRKQRSAAIGVLGSLGAGLCLVGFALAFFVSTPSFGVGGGPHAPTGLSTAVSDVLSLLSGAPTPFNALLCLVLIAGVALRRRLDSRELSLLASVAASVAIVLAASPFTAVRARYVLHAFPLFVLLVSLSVLRWRALGAAIFAAYAAGHVALLPCYYAGSCAAAEVSTGRRTPALVALLSADPQTPVAVTPAWAIAEPSWRLGRTFPGRGARESCPARLCARSGQRRFFGIESSGVEALLGTISRFYWIDRARVSQVPTSCRLALEEADTRLYLCARK